MDVRRERRRRDESVPVVIRGREEEREEGR